MEESNLRESTAKEVNSDIESETSEEESKENIPGSSSAIEIYLRIRPHDSKSSVYSFLKRNP